MSVIRAFEAVILLIGCGIAAVAKGVQLVAAVPPACGPGHGWTAGRTACEDL